MKKIAVVAGGFNEERGISMKSARMILENISRNTFDPSLVIIDSAGWRVVTDHGEAPINRHDFSYSISGERRTFDAAFIVIHGTPGVDGKLQGYFDLIGLPYTTGPQSAMVVTFSKFMCKDVLRANGFNVADYVLLRRADEVSPKELVHELGLPLVVKPNAEGSSLGASKVKTLAELQKACDHARKFDDVILIERFLSGVEVTCGVIKIDGEVTALPLTEIVPDREFYDFEAKYSGDSEEITPARIDATISTKIQKQCVEIWKLLGFKGMMRVDFIIEDGVPYALEVNGVPGFSETGFVPNEAEVFGFSKTDLITCILDSIDI